MGCGPAAAAVAAAALFRSVFSHDGEPVHGQLRHPSSPTILFIITSVVCARACVFVVVHDPLDFFLLFIYFYLFVMVLQQEFAVVFRIMFAFETASY